MGDAAGCRILAIIGSGETSPTMVTVHRELVSRLGAGRPGAVLLETPYAFQENAADVSARARGYFARSVGLAVTVAAGAAAGGHGEADMSGLRMLRAADWVFAGPGSPSYALAQWRASPVAEVLRDRMRCGDGVTVLASAAAATAGFAALPVYEIYKAGAQPHWMDGLDLMGELGLKVAVIPHYDNAEGGNHDTRYCYLGARRLSLLERELPADAAILGVDEHTAAVFDLRAATMQVCGRRGVTVRRGGASTVLPAGTTLPLARLRTVIRRGGTPGSADRARDPAPGSAPGPAPTGTPPPALPDIIRAVERRFDDAASARDAPGMVDAILDLEAAVHAWAADTEEDQGTEQARAVLRNLITRLGRAAQADRHDHGDRLLAAVKPLVTLRTTLRGEGRYPAADAIRDALAAAGVRLEDTIDGTRWRLRSPATPAQ